MPDAAIVGRVEEEERAVISLGLDPDELEQRLLVDALSDRVHVGLCRAERALVGGNGDLVKGGVDHLCTERADLCEQLQPHLLHERVDEPVDGGVVEQARGRREPAVGVHEEQVGSIGCHVTRRIGKPILDGIHNRAECIVDDRGVVDIAAAARHGADDVDTIDRVHELGLEERVDFESRELHVDADGPVHSRKHNLRVGELFLARGAEAAAEVGSWRGREPREVPTLQQPPLHEHIRSELCGVAPQREDANRQPRVPCDLHLLLVPLAELLEA